MIAPQSGRRILAKRGSSVLSGRAFGMCKFRGLTPPANFRRASGAQIGNLNSPAVSQVAALHSAAVQVAPGLLLGCRLDCPILFYVRTRFSEFQVKAAVLALLDFKPGGTGSIKVVKLEGQSVKASN
jgi:hypothetical protein